MRSFCVFFAVMLFAKFSCAQSTSRTLQVNLSTGLVSIDDSVRVGPNYRIDSINVLIEKWSNYMGDRNNAARAFGFLMRKRFTLIYSPIYAYGYKPGYYKAVTMYYEAMNEDGKVDASDSINGSVRFNINFLITGDYLVYSFTNLAYVGSRNEMANLEDSTLLGPDGVHFLTEAQKPWTKIKKEYYDRVQTLSQNFRRFLSTHYQSPNKPILLKERW